VSNVKHTVERIYSLFKAKVIIVGFAVKTGVLNFYFGKDSD
jgi:hypothetical protein